MVGIEGKLNGRIRNSLLISVPNTSAIRNGHVACFTGLYSVGRHKISHLNGGSRKAHGCRTNFCPPLHDNDGLQTVLGSSSFPPHTSIPFSFYLFLFANSLESNFPSIQFNGFQSRFPFGIYSGTSTVKTRPAFPA